MKIGIVGITGSVGKELLELKKGNSYFPKLDFSLQINL